MRCAIRGRPVDALHLYQEVLEVALHYGPLSLEAIERSRHDARSAGRVRELAEHYRIAWTHMKTPESSGYIATTPWYIMGDRYAKVLAETGEQRRGQGAPDAEVARSFGDAGGSEAPGSS